MPDAKLKIAFVMPNMEIGGSEKSLITLMNTLKDRNMDITLLLFQKKGSLLSYVPTFVKIVELSNAGGLENIRSKVSGFLMRIGAQRLFRVLKGCYHKFGSNFERKNIQEKKPFYDVAVAYKDGAATWYTSKNIPAKAKVAFIHTNFEKAQYDAASERKTYLLFQRIYCVSLTARDAFVRMMPQFSEKTKVLENFVNVKELKTLALAGETFQDGFQGIRILTVGRLSREKGLEKAVQALSLLKAEGFKVRWYVIGEGNERSRLRKFAEKLSVGSDFILLGQKENPYRYMNDCDIYVQTSDYEGYCITLTEAGILGKPIVCCDFAGARQRIADGETGTIAEMSAESVYQAVKELICDESLRRKYTNHLLQINLDNSSKADDFCNDIKSLVNEK